MKHIIQVTMAAAGLWLFAASGVLTAQQDHDNDQGWYQQRESYYHGQGWRARFFERIRMDLDHVQTNTFSGADQDRVIQTKHALDAMQRKLAEGRYDQPQLDETIAGMRTIVADNRLSARDRDMLNDDLNRLRDYRAHHENWR